MWKRFLVGVFVEAITGVREIRGRDGWECGAYKNKYDSKRIDSRDLELVCLYFENEELCNKQVYHDCCRIGFVCCVPLYRPFDRFQCKPLFILLFDRNHMRKLETFGDMLILEEKAICFQFQKDLYTRVHFKVVNCVVIETTMQPLFLMFCRILATSMYLRKR